MRSKSEAGVWVGGLGEEIDNLLDVLDVYLLAIAEILKVDTGEATWVLETS